MIRMGILDLVNEYGDTATFLNNQENLGDDLEALKRICKVWNSDKPIDIGESGTLYRLLQFASWKLGLNKKFIIHGTLKNREITNNPAIVNYPLAKLLELDNKTSQWASAAVLLGNTETIPNPPYKLALTYKAVKHWQTQRAKNESWQSRYDETILNQAVTFLKMLNQEKVDFKHEQAEDYCFARAFDFIAPQKGEKLWPSLRGHESDRIEEMEKALSDYISKKEIDSKDHRVVQAIAMKAKFDEKPVKFLHPSSVNKSWPQFWEFLDSHS